MQHGPSLSRGADDRNVIVNRLIGSRLYSELFLVNRRKIKMNTRGLLVTIFAVALSVAPQLVSTSSAAGTYSARLISPRVGQVLHPGQKVRVEWRSTLPNINFGACEMEVWLSVDGGATFTTCISPWLNPRAQFFDWTVPNMPTNAAVLDVRFRCEPGYPETYAPQPASTFVIAKTPH